MMAHMHSTQYQKDERTFNKVRCVRVVYDWGGMSYREVIAKKIVFYAYFVKFMILCNKHLVWLKRNRKTTNRTSFDKFACHITELHLRWDAANVDEMMGKMSAPTLEIELGRQWCEPKSHSISINNTKSISVKLCFFCSTSFVVSISTYTRSSLTWICL